MLTDLGGILPFAPGCVTATSIDAGSMPQACDGVGGASGQPTGGGGAGGEPSADPMTGGAATAGDNSGGAGN